MWTYTYMYSINLLQWTTLEYIQLQNTYSFILFLEWGGMVVILFNPTAAPSHLYQNLSSFPYSIFFWLSLLFEIPSGKDIYSWVLVSSSDKNFSRLVSTWPLEVHEDKIWNYKWQMQGNCLLVSMVLVFYLRNWLIILRATSRETKKKYGVYKMVLISRRNFISRFAEVLAFSLWGTISLHLL